ncbi:MAG TPA: glycoside hydrolase family 36 protein [Kribbella sp.]
MTSFEIRSPDGRTQRTGSLSGTGTITPRPIMEPGLQFYDLQCDVTADGPVTLRWTWPAETAVTLWRATQGSRRELPTDWGAHRDIRSVRSAPVAVLVDGQDRGLLTISLSASVRGCDFAVGVNEETAEQLVELTITDVEAGRFTLRIDTRPQHFADALRGVTADWTAELGERIAAVPPVAREAMYSTWYSDHQHVSAKSVERHARVSAAYGCAAVIVDDGWQTDDTQRGYAYCGDWEPTSQTFPDMAGHVRRVHDLGLRYVLWIAPPLIGVHSNAWDRLKHRTLGFADGEVTAVLDPRYPEVREHLLESCIRPVRDWNVDGLKIDFIDSWAWDSPPAPSPEADCGSVDEGVELLLQAITDELKRLRPDVLIEFRQDYVHPRLWQFGTFLRAGDCALDPVENRVRTIDCRLLAGDRAVHSDMLLWHPSASVENVAQHFIGALFSTAQVSMELDALSPEHERVVRYWLGFLRDHADALLDGVLLPSRSDARYTQVRAVGASEAVVAVFTNPVVRVADSCTLVVNGGADSKIYVEGAAGGPVDLVVSDCTGAEVHRSTTTPPALWVIDVPVGGVARIVRN